MMIAMIDPEMSAVIGRVMNQPEYDQATMRQLIAFHSPEQRPTPTVAYEDVLADSHARELRNTRLTPMIH